MSGRRQAVVAALAVMAVGACGRADEPATAPADSWPMARGCVEGTGVSAAGLRVPLVEAWRREFDGTAFGAAPVIAGGVVYAGDLDGTFHAVALADGTDRWSYTAPDAGFPSAAAVGRGGGTSIVVVGDDTGLVRAFDAGSGAVRWSHEMQGEVSGGPTILDDTAGGRVLVGSQDASLVCLDMLTGNLLWRHEIADQIRCSPTVARTSAGDRVLLAGCDGRLHVIDVATGTETAAVPIDGPTGTTPASQGDRVFFGTEGGAFFAIDVVKAEVAWRAAATAAGQSYRSSAALAAGLAIVGFRGRAIEAFSAADGSRAWKQPMRGRVEASPAVATMTGPEGAAARPVAIVADSAGRIAGLDAATGGLVWEFDAGGGFSSGAAVAAARVVLASDDGILWCFRSGD